MPEYWWGYGLGLLAAGAVNLSRSESLVIGGAICLICLIIYFVKGGPDAD